MANTDIVFALPNPGPGLSVTASASAWGYGIYVVVAESLARDIAVTGLQFQITNVPSLDTTNEQLFEIAVGPVSLEVTKLQFPYSMRMDTAVGYYMNHTVKLTLPEPYVIKKLERVSVRVANSIASAVVYDAVKLLYQAPSAVQRLTPLFGNYQYVKVGGGMSTGERFR